LHQHNKIYVNISKFTNAVVTRFEKCGDLVSEGEVFVKIKAEVASGVGCVER